LRPGTVGVLEVDIVGLEVGAYNVGHGGGIKVSCGSRGHTTLEGDYIGLVCAGAAKKLRNSRVN
jgi:hypothetical protein